jgi:hypothetical protein
MDSMSFLALQVEWEETFAINCTPDEILAANSFAAIAELVRQRANSRRTRAEDCGAAPSDTSTKEIRISQRGFRSQPTLSTNGDHASQTEGITIACGTRRPGRVARTR